MLSIIPKVGQRYMLNFLGKFWLERDERERRSHYHKLYGRVTNVCCNRRGHLKRSAMLKTRSGRSPWVIRFTSPSGKYAFYSKIFVFKFQCRNLAYGALVYFLFWLSDFARSFAGWREMRDTDTFFFFGGPLSAVVQRRGNPWEGWGKPRIPISNAKNQINIQGPLCDPYQILNW